MDYTKEIQDIVASILESKFNSDKTDKFFINIYSKLNIYAQAKVLSEFHNNIKFFNLYLSKSKEIIY